jgi:outer membrane lipoprotein carrier protein
MTKAMRDKLMSKYKIYIFSLLLVFFMMRIFADDANALAKHLMSFQTMTADFTQTVYDENHQVIQKNVGTMALSRPGKFRWAVETPNAQLLIADGAYLWIYDVDLSQATRQKLDKNKTTSPASLLSGSIENLEARFKVTQLNHTDNFKLVPKNKDDLFQSIVLSFTQNKLTHMQLMDNLGSLSLFEFNHVQIDAKMAPSVFQFTPPKNVDVIRN